MPKTMKARRLTSTDVLIVDHDTPVRAAMAEILMRRIGCRIAYAEPDLAKVIHHCQTRAPDLIIVDDWSGGRRTGLALALQIRASHPGAPLLVVHDRDCDVALEIAMAAGIQGFVLKGTNPDLLIASVRAVLAGETAYPPGPFPSDTAD